MYELYYHLKEKPFNLTPDPKFLYLSKHHQGALDHMLYGIRQREGFMVLTGDVGTGKTTLCRCLLDRLEKNIEVALILNPMLSDMDLLRSCVHDLRVQPLHARQGKPSLALNAAESNAGGGDSRWLDTAETDPGWVHSASKKELIDALNVFLLKQHKAGGFTVLIIDESQNLSLEVMEQLRILSNLETEKDKLLQIVFVGQLELNEKLKLPALKQLNQRISIRYEMPPLSKEETRNYINHRILVAGAGTASRAEFTNAALDKIYGYSCGYPRLINLVCDRSLLAGCNDQSETIDRPQVKKAIQSLLGEEEKGHSAPGFMKPKAILAASLVFFLAGLALFIFSFTHGKENPPVAAEGPPLPAAQESGPAATVAANPTPPAAGGTPAAPVIPAVAEKAPDSAAPTAVATAPADVKKETAPVKPPEIPSAVAVKPAEAPAKPTSAANAAETDANPRENFKIQVYSQPTEALADESVRDLKKEGFPAYWKKVESPGQPAYIIFVGPFKDIHAANIHFNTLKNSGRKPLLFSVTKAD